MRRRWKILLAGLGLAATAAATAPFWLPAAASLAEPWIRREVLAIAEDLLEPRVEIGRFEYRYPFGVDIVDLRLISKDASGEETTILDAPTVGIVLDRLPLTGPIVFRDFRLDGVTARFDALEDGTIVGWSDLLTGDDAAGGDDRPISEIFAIDTITVSDLTVDYGVRGSARRMSLDDLDFEIDNKARAGDDRVDLGRGRGWYQIDTTLHRENLFDIDLAGGIDIDTLDAELTRLHLDVVLDQDSVEHLPPQMQNVIVERKVEGRLDATMTGTFNLNDPRRDDTRFTLALGPTTFAFDEYLVEIAKASMEGRYESEVLRIEPFTIDMFEGTVDLTLKIADETTRGMPGETTPPETTVRPASEAQNPDTQSRLATLRSESDGVIPDAALGAAIDSAASLHAFGSLEIRDIQLQSIHRVNETDPSKIAGLLDTAMEFDFNLGRPIVSLGGGGEFSVEQGRFTGGPLVKALAKVMRILTLSPSQTDQFHTTFILRDEKLDLTTFSLLAGPIGARGRGTVGLVDQALDLRMNAGPLEGMQAGLGKIGDLTAIITDRLAKYVVRGTISEPNVTVAPLGLDIFGR
jgi:hypothetical protein